MANLDIEGLSPIIDSMSRNASLERQIQERNIKAEVGLGLEEIEDSSETKGKTFSEMLKDSLSRVNEYQTQSDVAVKELVAGRTKNIHEAILAMERADMSLKLMMQVRNKIVDAYREIMRMQV